MLTALERGGITTAFPIQAATIADALAGKDVLGKARTGSGKTLGFGLPVIARLAEGERPVPRKPRAVVLVPTRELAMQVNDALEPYAHAMRVSIRLVAGGLSMSKQVMALERGVHLLVATPGRLADLVRRGDADMADVAMVVLDEADHMADMGFMDEINEILDQVPVGGQRLLFSATLDGDVDNLVAQRMVDPVLHDVTGGESAVNEMSHVVLNIPPHIKYQIATRIAAREGRTLVFVRTKLAADRIADQMRHAGVLAIALHGDKAQAERNAAITGFRAGTVPVLVATDVAARGIHVEAVDLVLQLDPPADHKDYTHRAGRTARAGKTGLVVTLVLPHQRKGTDRLLETAGIEPTFRKVRGDDADSLALVDSLTGAAQPSGIPVAEPRLPRTARDRNSTRERPGRGGPREGRDSRGRSSGGRATNTRPPYERGRATTGAPDAREQSLHERERALAERERAIAEREASLNAAPTDRSRYDKRRAPQARTDRPRTDRPRTDKPRTDKFRSAQPRTEKPRTEKPRTDKPRTSKPRSESREVDASKQDRYPSSGSSNQGKPRKAKGSGKKPAAGSSRRGQARPKKKR